MLNRHTIASVLACLMALASFSSVAAGNAEDDLQKQLKGVEEMYAEYDAHIAARSGRKPWVPSTNLRAAILSAMPSAKVSQGTCGADMCRFDVSYRVTGPKDDFAERLANQEADHEGILFRYLTSDSSSMQLYFLRPGAPRK